MNDALEKPNLTQVEYFKDIVGTLREPLLVLDKDLRVLAANRSFYKTFKVKQKDTLGNQIYDLGNRQWDIPALRALLETILPKKALFNDYFVEHDFPIIGNRGLLLNARRIPAPPKKATWILLAFEDVTERMQQERSLRASEQRFRRAFETAHDGMLLIEKTGGRILNSNQSAEDMLGYSKTSLQKKRLWEVGILKDEQQFRQTALELEAQGIVGLAETTIPNRKGRHFPADVFLMNRAALIQCNIRDITDRKKIIDALKDNEKKYFDLVDQSPDGIFLIESSGKITTINEAMCKELGFSQEELLSMSIWDIILEQYLDQTRKRLTEILEGKNFGKASQYAVSGKDGKVHYIEIQSAPHYSGKDIVGFRGIARDVSERKRAEEKLSASENELRTLFASMTDVVFVLDRDGRYLRIAPTNPANLFRPSQDLLGKTIHEVLPKEQADFILAKIKEAIQTNQAVPGEYAMQIEGKEIWFESRASRLTENSVIWVAHDITERKQAEEMLRASQRQYQTLAEVSPVGIFHTDASGKTTYVNQRWYEISGLSAEEALKNGWLRAVHPDDRKPLIDGWEAAVQEQRTSTSEYRFLRPDGTIRWVMGLAAPETNPDGKIIGYVGTITDITERKRAEQALAESAIKFKWLYEYAPVAYHIVSPDGTITDVNHMWCELLGFRREEAIGKPIFDFMVEQERQSAKVSFDRKKQSRQLYIEGGERDYRTKAGAVKTVKTYEFFLFDEGQNVSSVQTTIVDITERRRAEEQIERMNAELEQRVEERTRELHQAQEQLVRKEKLAVLGALAGGVGHELRNPLGVISSSVYYLNLVQPDANEKIKQYHAMIDQEVHNATRIIGDLLDYARVIKTDPRPASVRALVEHTFSCFPVPTSVRVSLKIPAGLPQVYADPLHVQQILGNLITNACQAMKAGGTLTISAQRRPPSSLRTRKSGVGREQWVRISVKDTGTGVTPENLQKLFEPLFSTKVTGIGLGLAVSQKLAEANGGKIEVKSEAGHGSTFTLYLPLRAEKACAKP